MCQLEETLTSEVQTIDHVGVIKWFVGSLPSLSPQQCHCDVRPLSNVSQDRLEKSIPLQCLSEMRREMAPEKLLRNDSNNTAQIQMCCPVFQSPKKTQY